VITKDKEILGKYKYIQSNLLFYYRNRFKISLLNFLLADLAFISPERIVAHDHLHNMTLDQTLVLFP
jgi:hypothetical protein